MSGAKCIIVNIYLRRKEILLIFFCILLNALPTSLHDQQLLDYFWDISRDWERDCKERQLCMGDCAYMRCFTYSWTIHLLCSYCYCVSHLVQTSLVSTCDAEEDKNVIIFANVNKKRPTTIFICILFLYTHVVKGQNLTYRLYSTYFSECGWSRLAWCKVLPAIVPVADAHQTVSRLCVCNRHRTSHVTLHNQRRLLAKFSVVSKNFC